MTDPKEPKHLTDNSRPPFEFGQIVYGATASSHAQIRVLCPVCFGKCMAHVILGDESVVPVECDFCSAGCNPPSGYVTRHEAASRVVVGAVSSMERDGDDWKVCIGGHYESFRVSEGNVFAHEDDAETRRALLHAEAEVNAQRMYESRFKDGRRKTTWSVGYHRNCIRDLKRQLEWHETKLRAKAEAAQ